MRSLLDKLKDDNAAAVVMLFLQAGFLHDQSGGEDGDITTVIKVPLVVSPIWTNECGS